MAVGDEVEATVVGTGDEIRLSHKLRRGAQAREALEMAAQSGITVEGRVAAVIKGGYEVTLGGLRAFCPFSQMDLRRVESEQEYVGRVLEFRVTKYGENGRNIVVSRRQILQEQAAKAAEETRKKLGPRRDPARHGDVAGRLRRLRRSGRHAGAGADVRAVALAGRARLRPAERRRGR